MWLLELIGWVALGALFGATSIFLHGRASLGKSAQSRLLVIGATGGYIGGLTARAVTSNAVLAMLCAGAGAMLALAVFDRDAAPTSRGTAVRRGS